MWPLGGLDDDRRVSRHMRPGPFGYATIGGFQLGNALVTLSAGADSSWDPLAGRPGAREKFPKRRASYVLVS
jgi:hypothetical protein